MVYTREVLGVMVKNTSPLALQVPPVDDTFARQVVPA